MSFGRAAYGRSPYGRLIVPATGGPPPPATGYGPTLLFMGVGSLILGLLTSSALLRVDLLGTAARRISGF